MIEERRGWLAYRIVTVVAVVTFIAFLPVLQAGFVLWDDRENFIDNPDFQGLGWATVAWAFTTANMGVYIPLSWLTLAGDHSLWGLNPFGYHLTNLLLHAAAAAVFYLVAARLVRAATSPRTGTESREISLGAGLAAMLFAVHPLRVESVAWITERRDVLSGLFFLLSILAYLQAWARRTEGGTLARGWYAGALGLFVLALLSKPMAISLPAVLVILDVYPLRRLTGGPGSWFGLPNRAVWLEKIPFVLLSLATGLMAMLAQIRGGTVASMARFGALERLAISVYSVTFHLWKTAVPFHLAPLYELPPRIHPFAWSFLLSGGVVLAVTGIAILVRGRWPALLAVWLAYLVMLLPVMGVVPHGPQIAADRFTYLPCLGWALLASGGLLAGWRRWARGAAPRGGLLLVGGLVALLVASLGGLTWRQARIWRDSETLWTHALAVRPSAAGHMNLGVVRAEQGRLTEAISHYQQALAIDPSYAKAHGNWGAALARQGRVGEAIGHYRQALDMDPQAGAVHVNWGLALAAQGRLPEAIEHYEQALRLDPGLAEAHGNWGVALAEQGRIPEAIEQFRQALRINPRFAEAHHNWGAALLSQGRFAEAIDHFQEALRIQPSFAAARATLRSLLGQAGAGQPSSPGAPGVDRPPEP
jgi:tetratricopeptide (TPR) repeat protein